MKRFARNLLVGILASFVTAAHATEDDFQLENYGSSIVDGAVLVNADFIFGLPYDVRAALNRGVDLIFVVDIEVYNPIDYLPDENLVSIDMRRRLSYHALTKKYTVDDLTFGHRSSHHRLEDAVAEIGRVRDVNLIDASIVRANRAAIVKLRINLAFSELPFPLRLQALVLPDWYINSPWFAWTLNRNPDKSRR